MKINTSCRVVGNTCADLLETMGFFVLDRQAPVRRCGEFLLDFLNVINTAIIFPALVIDCETSPTPAAYDATWAEGRVQRCAGAYR